MILMKSTTNSAWIYIIIYIIISFSYALFRRYIAVQMVSH